MDWRAVHFPSRELGWQNKMQVLYLGAPSGIKIIELEAFIRVITLFFLDGSVCFRVYDLNDDTLVSMEEMYHMLKNCLPGLPTKEERDEGVKDLVEITFKKMVRGRKHCWFTPLNPFKCPLSKKQISYADISPIYLHNWLQAHFIILQDRDHDGRLSFSDFEQSVKEENLLLEAFGTCLPNFKVKTNQILWKTRISS